MKPAILLLAIGITGISLSGRAQTITFTGKDVPIKEIFRVIKEQTGYRTFYSRKLLEHTTPVTIHVRDMALTDFLKLVLADQLLDFRIDDKTILFSESKAPPSAPESGEDHKPHYHRPVISGKVTSRDGSALAAVSIQAKGQSAGTTTNNEGKFRLSGPGENTVLKISRIGYLPVELVVKNSPQGYTVTATVQSVKKDLKVTPGKDISVHLILARTTSDLEESIVIAYGSVKKRDLTGSVVSIKGGDITATPVNNVMEALQGKIAGMDIMRTSGAVGTNADILLRGNRSIYGDNAPLFIVDGIQTPYSQVNPSDIASIDVLKDASSTAIYGSAGSNGVVIITTKRGRPNKRLLTIDAFYGYSATPHFFHSMIKDEYIQYSREAYRTLYGEYPQDLSLIFNSTLMNAINEGKWIDWIKEISNNNATQQKYNFSFSGGGGKTSVYSSLTYTRESGILTNENQTRMGIRLNVDHEASRWLKLGTYLNINYTIRNARAKNIFTKSLAALPLGEPRDAAGHINPLFIEGEFTPLGDELPNQFADNKRSVFATLNAYLELKPLNGLLIRSALGTTLDSYRQGKYWGKLATSNVPAGYAPPIAAIYNGFGYGYMWENIATYTKSIAADHQIVLTGITSWADNRSDYNNSLGQGQEQDYYLFYNIGSGTERTSVGSSYQQRQRLSFAGRINYSFRGKYLLSLTNRWDGASHLAAGHQWSAFPSGAIAWRVSDEPFMKGLRGWLHEMKLRLGYGVTGNAGGLSVYSSKTQAYTYQVISLEGSVAPNIQNAGTYSNPSISWERSYNLNLGLDLILLKDRVDLAVDVYNTDTRDLLFLRTLPVTAAITAWGSPMATWQNIGRVNNKGWEVTLKTRNVVSASFAWGSAFAFTRNKEKIINLPDGDIPASRLFEGHPINTHYDYKYLGIWSSKEAAEAALYGARPGYVKIATNERFDANGTGDGGKHPYTTTDKMILGSSNPSWLLGINNTFRYKNFDLSVFTMVRWGQMIESKLMSWYDADNDGLPAGINYWTPENQQAHYPRPGISNTIGVEAIRYVDGSFIKFKTITLGYSIPEECIKSGFIKSGRIYATAYNPWIYTKNKLLKGTDPETNGADYFPLFATYVMGVNIVF